MRLLIHDIIILCIPLCKVKTDWTSKPYKRCSVPEAEQANNKKRSKFSKKKKTIFLDFPVLLDETVEIVRVSTKYFLNFVVYLSIIAQEANLDSLTI